MTMEQPKEKKKLTILVVEDHNQMREFIQSFLEDTYSLLLAENGNQGFEMAKAEIPDLILTDVSMPEKDGFEFCRLLKSTMDTAHIPVLMITAMALEQDQLKGYESGAADYITKPFNVSILKLKINNLLETIQRLRGKFSMLHNNFEEYTSNRQDAEFMKKVIQYISIHFQNQELAIDHLAEEVGMSRSSFYRKTMAISGKSPHDLLQMYRLQQAHELLMQSNLSVSEVAYQVGYTDPGYFSTRFKEFYQTSPSALVQKRKKE